jgi:hypothetical protein
LRDFGRFLSDDRQIRTALVAIVILVAAARSPDAQRMPSFGGRLYRSVSDGGTARLLTNTDRNKVPVSLRARYDQPALSPQQSFVVERARVGPVSIGGTADSIYREFGDRARLIDLKLEGHLSPAIEIKLFESQLVASIIAEIGPANNQLVVTRIHVVDPSLRTRDGIGVGSTYGELRSRHQVDWVGSGEGKVFARVEKLAISVELDASGPMALSSIRDPEKVPAGVRIVSLMLTR